MELDADFIKMFVGQIPKTMDERQLRHLFEEFGKVQSINVLRDKLTGISKGELLFLKFFSKFFSVPVMDLNRLHYDYSIIILTGRPLSGTTLC